MQKNSIEAEVANYTGKLLRDHFGKGPGSVYVSIKETFITIYLKDFLAPIEKVLLTKDDGLRVQETRDVMMNELIPDIRAMLRSKVEINAEDVYYDWSLDRKTGMIFTSVHTDSPIPQSDYPNKEKIHEEIRRMSIQAQKDPQDIISGMLNDRTLVVIRKGILVDIEKELIANGFIEELKLSKRPLEKRLLSSDRLKSLLNGELEDVFVDWDFNLDLSYIIFVKKPF